MVRSRFVVIYGWLKKKKHAGECFFEITDRVTFVSEKHVAVRLFSNEKQEEALLKHSLTLRPQESKQKAHGIDWRGSSLNGEKKTRRDNWLFG